MLNKESIDYKAGYNDGVCEGLHRCGVPIYSYLLKNIDKLLEGLPKDTIKNIKEEMLVEDAKEVFKEEK